MMAMHRVYAPDGHFHLVETLDRATEAPPEAEIAPALPTRFWYMASPYRKYPLGIQAASEAASRFAAALFDRGIQIYSPIALSHEIARYTTLDPMDEAWLAAQVPFMTAARGLIVAKINTWDLSSGIAWERTWFSERGRPIYMLDDPLPEQLPGGLKP